MTGLDGSTWGSDRAPRPKRPSDWTRRPGTTNRNGFVKGAVLGHVAQAFLDFDGILLDVEPGDPRRSGWSA